MNYLYYGDCLTIIDEFKLSKVDLIYLDPPFNSNRTYSAIYKDEIGRPLPVQVEAFCDMWELTPERQRAIERIPILVREQGIDDAVAEFWRLWMNALRYTNPKLLAYLSYMVERLVLMKGILRATGSIYLHCDPTCSHYLKVIMDGIFGHENFCNEIVWHYKNRWPAKAKKWQSLHDTILFYSKSKKMNFNPVMVEGGRVKKDIERGWGTDTIERNGKRIPRIRVYNRDKVDLAISTGRLSPDVEIVDQTGKTGMRPAPDVWDINLINPRSKERMGYATQKPLALLERIISASSNPGDVILDPFCGCASTLEAAHKLKRKWIGIDIAFHAVNRVARIRLEDRLKLKDGKDFEIKGVPLTVDGAQDLWEKDPYQFQKWAVERAEGFVSTKRTADGGIDGRIYFSDSDTTHSMVVEVKGGENVSISHVRALRGVLDDDLALMAGLIILHPLRERQRINFNRFMASAGHVEIKGKAYPRMQVLSVADILDGKGFDTPTRLGRHQDFQIRMDFE